MLFLFGEKICCTLNKYLYFVINNTVHLRWIQPLKQVQIIYQIMIFFFFFCLFVPRTITLFGLEFKEESRKMVSVVQSSSHVKRCELFLALREWTLTLWGDLSIMIPGNNLWVIFCFGFFFFSNILINELSQSQPFVSHVCSMRFPRLTPSQCADPMRHV